MFVLAERDCPLNDDEKAALPLIDPFGRVPQDRRNSKGLQVGESHRDGFEQFIYDAIRDHTPTEEQGFVVLTREEAEAVRTGRKSDRTDEQRNATFLWIIDEDRIRMIRERTPNELRDPKYVCHTNLTGNAKARIGGELFFCEDGAVIVSQSSDRYGWATEEQFEVALNYFRRVGYHNLLPIAPY